MKHHFHKLLICAAVVINTFFILAAPAMAANPSGTPETSTVQTEKPRTPKNANKWSKTKKGFYIYYNKQGKKSTGLTTIGKKKYFFNSKGLQVNGWQKINNSYYYFRIANGSKAYMLTNTKVNGIQLNKTGKAILKNSTAKAKAKLLYNAQVTVRKIITNNNLTKSKKLRTIYDWTQKNNNIRKTNIGGFRSGNKNWDIYYAGLILNARTLPSRGDCYTYASTFGYLANAIGYKATICSSGGHGYVMIDNRFYDPSWQKAIRNQSYFNLSWDAVAQGLGLRYRTNMKYKKVV